MLLTLHAHGKTHTCALPDDVAGMHAVADGDGEDARRFGFVQAKEGEWVLFPASGLMLADEGGGIVEHARIEQGREQRFQIGDPAEVVELYARPTCEGDKTFAAVGFAGDQVIAVGSDEGADLRHPSRFVSARHARIDYVRDEFFVTDLSSESGTYVNKTRLAAGERTALAPCDVVEVMGLVMAVGRRFLSFNDPGGRLAVRADDNFVYYRQPAYEPPARAPAPPAPEYFYPAPRFKRDVERRTFSVDAPPAPERFDDAPVAMKIGPSMAMGLGAVASGAAMFMRMQESGGSLLMAAPLLAMALSLVLGSVLWPALSRRFERKKAADAEARRHQAYAAYLDSVRAALIDESARQKEVLEENRITIGECVSRALGRDPRLMDRTRAHDDFLELRVGRGTVPLDAEVRYPEEHFSVEKDDLSQVVFQLAREPKEIGDAPVSTRADAGALIGVAGAEPAASDFLRGLVVQIACLHSYEDVKLVVLADESRKDQWAWAASLPHAFSDDGRLRFFAATLEEAAEVGLVLEPTAEERRGQPGRGPALPHYVVVCASKRLAGRSELVGGLARVPAPGFSMICLAASRKDLPKQCTAIVEAGPEGAVLHAVGDASDAGRAFAPDIGIEREACEMVARALNAVRLDVAGAERALPESVSFLDMFEAGSVEQLGVRSRWREARASETLAARVGVGKAGEPFFLNLHERFHGPHGLIAGTTGSGKSELIITWILSMACEYSPEQASFVLIDYKGGGLAGAFEGDRARLPHLAGTVTNLDGAAVARSLVSIASELRRRQALFNEARAVAGGDNVDVYRYLELYREGRVAEPCPHLFIVADEFAELKDQQPEFMDELISAARIGRSLGVHLVLATQKPTGVVNDQIWSNSKFKACLKVADAADSKEMIRRPDAAELVQAGRFYLLVGYNEQFSLGQAAWAGAPYEPAERFEPARDDAVVLASSTGRALAQASPPRPSRAGRPASQLAAVLACVAQAAAEEGLAARRLWLDPLPERMAIEELRERCARDPAREQRGPFCLEALVGMLDDPASQDQRPLRLELTRKGNAVVYGSAGSGTDTVASAVLYSLLGEHGSEELNVYIMDFGAETLGSFRHAPQVGDVVFSGDDEKVRRLFALLSKEVAERKKIVASYADFSDYCRKDPSHRPSVLVVMNDMSAFYELYEREEQLLVTLTREGNRCGVYFLVTATAPTGLRMRLRANFKQALVTQFNDEGDYGAVLGSMRGIVPPRAHARGLVRLEGGIFEYQSAYVGAEGESEYDAIASFARSLQDNAGAAVRIPTLPEKLHPEDLERFEKTSKRLPFGLYEETLSPASFDLSDHCIERVLYAKSLPARQFIVAMLAYLETSGEIDFMVLDAGLFCDGSEFDGREKIVKDDDGILGYLERLSGMRHVPRPRNLVVFTMGMANLLIRAAPDRAQAVKELLRTLTPSENTTFVLVDSASAATGYMQQEWFKEQASSQDALWVGEGLSNQTALALGYTSKPINPKVKSDMGYVVEAGLPVLAKLVSAVQKEEDHESLSVL